jgi:hypothetical protein
MGMLAFYARLSDLAFKETRSVTVPAGNPMPPDEYGFLELYCTDENCDCRRVIVKVLGQHSGDKVWATISYGWESAAFYRKWSPGWDNAAEWHRPTLDPLNPQTEFNSQISRPEKRHSTCQISEGCVIFAMAPYKLCASGATRASREKFLRAWQSPHNGANRTLSAFQFLPAAMNKARSRRSASARARRAP